MIYNIPIRPPYGKLMIFLRYDGLLTHGKSGKTHDFKDTPIISHIFPPFCWNAEQL